MKRVVLLIATFYVVSFAIPVSAQNPNANWRALATKAYKQADLVMHGTVQSVDDQTMVDGGHVYSIQVTSLEKGAPTEQVLVRAGGFFYHVPLDVGESVLVFLKSNSVAKPASGDTSATSENFSSGGKSRGQGPAYSLVEVATLRPMVFRVSGKNARPVDKRLQSEFANVTNEELGNLLSAINP